MKQKIRYGFGAGAVVWTVILWVVIITLFILYWAIPNAKVDLILFWVMAGTIFLLAGCSLYMVPFSVSVDDEYINVRRFLRTNKYKISEIKSIEPTKVSRKDLKKYLGTGDWPKYYLGGEGQYYSYYGSPKNPVLIKFNDGERLIIGTSDQKEFLDAVNSHRQ